MSKSKKFPCPICGQEIQAQGQAGHNRSKFHIAALERLNEANTTGETVQQQKEIKEPEPPKAAEQPPKPVESIPPENIKSGLGDPATKKSGTFLDWLQEEDDDF